MTKITFKREVMWAAHNLIAHPVSELAYWVGFVWPRVRLWGDWLHDATTPEHTPGTGRG